MEKMVFKGSKISIFPGVFLIEIPEVAVLSVLEINPGYIVESLGVITLEEE